MVGKRLTLIVLLIAIVIGSTAGSAYHTLIADETVWEDGPWGANAHQPHQDLGGQINIANQTMQYEFRIADTNASILVMSPEDWDATQNGSLAYDRGLSHVGISNTTVLVDIPSGYKAEMYAGDTTTGSIYTVHRETQGQSWEGALLIGAIVVVVIMTSFFLFVIHRGRISE